MSPVIDWLRARLEDKGPVAQQEVLDEAKLLAITNAELDEAFTKLKIKKEQRIPAAGGFPYVVWVLPSRPKNWFHPGSDPRRYRPEKRDALVSTPEAPLAKKAEPKERVKQANEILQRRAPTAARRIIELAERASRDAVPCPACGRGMPRDEKTILAAAKEVLEKAGAGVGAKRQDGDEGGPVIVFPPGTKVAVLAQVPGGPEETRDPGTMTRGDLA